MSDPLLNTQIGNYVLVDRLGQGGFADVYRGQHIHLNISVAIKVLQARLQGKEEEDFRKEAILLANLKHKNIVTILDYGFTGNRQPYLMMDLARKGALSKAYPYGTILSLLEVVAFVSQIADGLSYAHQQQIVHRDIKPENILVGDNDELLLADFGIARVVQSSKPGSNIAGTFAYMAPEMFSGKMSFATDQYALGITIYTWLTGRHPFEGNLAEMVAQHMHAIPALPHLFNPVLSTNVETVILTALKKEPYERFGSISAFANALRQAAEVDEKKLIGVKPRLKNTEATRSPIRISDPRHDLLEEQQQPFLPNKTPLLFTALPTLPKANVTEYWWPTFDITVEHRRLINQNGLPSELLGSMGQLTGFPSLPISLPVSNAPILLETGKESDRLIIGKKVVNIENKEQVITLDNKQNARTKGAIAIFIIALLCTPLPIVSIALMFIASMITVASLKRIKPDTKQRYWMIVLTSAEVIMVLIDILVTLLELSPH